MVTAVMCMGGLLAGCLALAGCRKVEDAPSQVTLTATRYDPTARTFTVTFASRPSAKVRVVEGFERSQMLATFDERGSLTKSFPWGPAIRRFRFELAGQKEAEIVVPAPVPLAASGAQIECVGAVSCRATLWSREGFFELVGPAGLRFAAGDQAAEMESSPTGTKLALDLARWAERISFPAVLSDPPPVNLEVLRIPVRVEGENSLQVGELTLEGSEQRELLATYLGRVRAGAVPVPDESSGTATLWFVDPTRSMVAPRMGLLGKAETLGDVAFVAIVHLAPGPGRRCTNVPHNALSKGLTPSYFMQVVVYERRTGRAVTERTLPPPKSCPTPDGASMDDAALEAFLREIR